MCLGCWQESGSPWLVTPAVDRWAPVFANVDPYGQCHIVVDDWNLDDNNIKSCLADTQDEQERELMAALVQMSEPERWATAIRADDPTFDPLVYRDQLKPPRQA